MNVETTIYHQLLEMFCSTEQLLYVNFNFSIFHFNFILTFDRMLIKVLSVIFPGSAISCVSDTFESDSVFKSQCYVFQEDYDKG